MNKDAALRQQLIELLKGGNVHTTFRFVEVFLLTNFEPRI
jgi:hypothetical protein